MAQSYILKGTENEYLLVVRAEDEKAIYNLIDLLMSSRNKEIVELAIELEKSMHDNGRSSGKTRPKNKVKSTVSNKGRSRKTKNT